MSTTVEIPGGTAKIRELSEMTVRQRRMVQASYMATSYIYAQLPPSVVENATVLKGKEGLDAREKLALMIRGLRVTRTEAEDILSLQDASIVAFLESWDLDMVLPTMDNVQDLPPKLYDALAIITAPLASKLSLGSVDLDPTPGGEDSPFGDSATSRTKSDTQTKTGTSTKKRRNSGANTSTAVSTRG